MFWSIANFQNTSIDAAEIVLLAVGEAFLLGAGEFDISLGANIVLSSVLGGEVMIHVGELRPKSQSVSIRTLRSHSRSGRSRVS